MERDAIISFISFCKILLNQIFRRQCTSNNCDHQDKKKDKTKWYSGYLRVNSFESLLHWEVKICWSKVRWTELRLNAQCKRVTKVGYFFSVNHYLHSTNCKRLNFVTGRTNLQHTGNVYLSWPFNYFLTFDESRCSHHLINLVDCATVNIES